MGMGKDLFDAYPEAKAIYDKADDILSFKISDLCFNGPEEDLVLTRNSQAAIFITSIATLEAVKKEMPNLKPDIVCGLSLGEFSALVAAQSLDFEEGLRLVRKRGVFMDEAANENRGTMASLIGLSKEEVFEICRKSGAEVANYNSKDQIVVSGRKEAIEKAVSLAETMNVRKAVVLKVSGAFHSSLMWPARTKLAEELKTVKIRGTVTRFIPNVTAEFESEPDKIRENLKAQVTNSVRWAETMQLLAKEGVEQCYEVGPGKVLKGLAKRNKPSIPVTSVGSVPDMQSLKDQLLKA